MKLKRARTCNGCWSVEQGHGTRSFCCDLHYKIKTRYDRTTSTPIEGIPQEPCMKPLTGDQWIAALKAAEAAGGGDD